MIARVRYLILFILISFSFICSCTAYGVGIRSRQGMVVSAHHIASEIGISILKKGGNAVDAAVAVGFALAVVYPEAGNLGGGGFMIYRSRNGDITSLDFRETAPKSSSRDMYIDSAGNISRDIVRGHKSAGVPGTVAGLVTALKKYGTMNLDDVIRPAIEAAYKGFPVDRNLYDNLMEYRDDFREWESTLRVFTRDGEFYKEGDTIRMPDLAATLVRIRDTDGRDFYTGKTADLIIEEMQRGGGYITKGDLSEYRVTERSPLRGSYRGYDVYSVSPPSSGGICLLGVLNLLEGFDLSSMGFHSSAAVHMMVEAMKLVYADRAYFLGDPAYTEIPVEKLISKEYASEQREKIDTFAARRSSEIRPDIFIHDGLHTTHYSVIDKDRNCVAVTYTVNDLFGSQVIVDGAGFFLNNEMDDFSAKPGFPNSYGLVGGTANSIAAGKRPLSSMTPTIVLKDGKPFMILGARGGSRIITAVLQVIVNVIDFGMDISKAVEVPRFHNQWLPEEIISESFCFPADVINNLISRGHDHRVIKSSCGEVQAILIDPETGWIYGGPDPRENGVVIGY